jgi:UDP-glucuronate 4-epimerase
MATTGIPSVLITGGAGFIGFHTASRLKADGCDVTVIDNFCPDYNPQLKRDRAAVLKELGIAVVEQDVEDTAALNKLFDVKKFTHVVHLAGHGNVRQSKCDPSLYMRTNVDGCFNVFEAARTHSSPEHRIPIVFATSSSVYGDKNTLPFSEDEQPVPMSWYGETKKIDEQIAHQFYRQFGMPSVGLRFFTVYGPWGRPDMAVYLFADKMKRGDEITLFRRDGVTAKRDFAYVGDISAGIRSALFKAKALGHEIINLGNNRADSVEDLVRFEEEAFGCTAKLTYGELPDTDPIETRAKMDKAERLLGFVPTVALAEGIKAFAQWHKEYPFPKKS